MLENKNIRIAARFAVSSFLLLILSSSFAIYGQEGDSIEMMKAKVSGYMKEEKYAQALPLLEKIVEAEPEDSQSRFYLGFALIAQSKTVKDSEQRKALLVRARNSFIKAKELGMKEPIVDALISSIPPDGSEGKPFSENSQANELMNDAEAMFSQGKLDEALVAYQKALALDPKIYEAALFSGDVYNQRNDYANAEIWYQKAIAIDPNRETGYRYSATPLMKQKKYDEARDRYVEAFVVEPYSKYPVQGLTQWSNATNTPLAHPKIDIPTNIKFDEKGDAKIDLDINVLGGGKDDGSFAWIAYGTTRSIWHKDKFAKTFPKEKEYRHSLAEEVDALRAVLAIATEKKSTTLSPSLVKLKKLNDDGLLEPYILMARADQGIAQDYADYLKQNRAKLRRYVVEYVLTNGGK